ncbi:MAG: glycosyltransferase, partial [Bacteroidota bacterium]
MIKDNKTLAYTYTSGRKKCYCKENVFVASPTKSIQVIKRKLYKNDCPPDQPIKLLLTNEQYFKGRLLSVDLLNIVSREGWTTGDLSVWAGTYYEILKSYAEQKSGSLFVPGKYLDLTPFNILIDSADKAVVFDQEWSCDEDVPLYFIFFRGIVYSLGKIFSFATPAEGTPDDLIELVITLINRIFPFDAADLQKCISLEEKYFSPVPLLPGKAFAYGKLKINAATGHLPEIIVQKEEVIARQKNEVEQKKKKITELESELRQNEQRQAKFAAQLEDQREELHRLSETFRFRLEALEKDVAWYRQTYEERSVVGVLKEKLGQGIRKQYRKIFGRLLNNRTVKGKYVLTYLLEYIRDEGLKNFFSLYADMIRSKGITALLHPRKAILSRMQPDAEADLILSPGLPDPVPAIEKLKEEMQALRYRPKISLIFPTYNTKPSLLGMAISSIKDQVYDNWELCIVDDHSTRQETINLLHSHFDDARIKLKVLARNAGISEASNTAIKMATGDYIALMDDDDELTPDALLRIAQELNERGEADILYSDECKVDEQGNLSEYFFKPDWSPELLLNMMYPGHLTVYKKDFLLSEVGWFRKEYDFSQDYDLMLRATEKTTNIRHLKKILYHWRLTEGSASRGDKPHARRTNLAALAEAIKRRNVNADIIELPTANRVKLRFEAKPKVSIIIPTDSSRNLKEAIESITARTIYPDYELVVVTNSGLIKEMQKQFDLANLIYTAYDKPYNFSDKCNWGARHARGEIVIFFNDDVRPLEDDWIENTIEYLFVAGVGGVSPKLVYEDGTLQYAGMAVGVRGLIGTTLHGYPEDSVSYMNYPQLVRDVSILSGACLAMRKALFFEVGGFDAVNVPSAHSDVDLSFKIIEKGLHCV